MRQLKIQFYHFSVGGCWQASSSENLWWNLTIWIEHMLHHWHARVKVKECLDPVSMVYIIPDIVLVKSFPNDAQIHGGVRGQLTNPCGTPKWMRLSLSESAPAMLTWTPSVVERGHNHLKPIESSAIDAILVLEEGSIIPLSRVPNTTDKSSIAKNIILLLSTVFKISFWRPVMQSLWSAL